jgi:hypothetical protein
MGKGAGKKLKLDYRLKLQKSRVTIKEGKAGLTVLPPSEALLTHTLLQAFLFYKEYLSMRISHTCRMKVWVHIHWQVSHFILH